MVMHWILATILSMAIYPAVRASEAKPVEWREAATTELLRKHIHDNVYYPSVMRAAKQTSEKYRQDARELLEGCVRGYVLNEAVNLPRTIEHSDLVETTDLSQLDTEKFTRILNSEKQHCFGYHKLWAAGLTLLSAGLGGFSYSLLGRSERLAPLVAGLSACSAAYCGARWWWWHNKGMEKIFNAQEFTTDLQNNFQTAYAKNLKAIVCPGTGLVHTDNLEDDAWVWSNYPPMLQKQARDAFASVVPSGVAESEDED